MTRNKFIMILNFLSVLSLATACQANKQSSSDNPPLQSVASKIAPVIDKPTKLVMYQEWGLTTDVFMDVLGKYIVRKYPYVTIEVINEKTGKLQDLVAAGVNIDFVVHVENYVGTMKQLGLASDLSDLIKKYDYDLNLWEPSIADYIRGFHGGKIPGIPIAMQTLAFYYNKDLFSKFGVPFPKDDMTWDDVQELSKRLTREDGGVQYYGYASANTGNFLAFNPLSLPIIDPVKDKAIFDTDPWRNYLRKLVDISTIHGVPPIKGNVLNHFIKEGRLAMISTNSSNFPTFKQNPALNWDIASFPSFKELPGVGTQPEFTMWYIPSNSRNKEAAFIVAMEMTSLAVQRERSMDGDITVLKNEELRQVFGSRLTELGNKNAKALIPKQLAKKTPYSKYFQEGLRPLNTEFAKVLEGTKDLNTALRDAIELANKNIEEVKRAE